MIYSAYTQIFEEFPTFEAAGTAPDDIDWLEDDE